MLVIIYIYKHFILLYLPHPASDISYNYVAIEVRTAIGTRKDQKLFSNAALSSDNFQPCGSRNKPWIMRKNVNYNIRLSNLLSHVVSYLKK